MTIKGVWGFNGTERPGAVYLASVLATHAQKGLPAFGIYGHEVQDRDQVTEIPDDVKEKLLRFGRAAVAVATMRGKSYLQIGSVTMGIGGSIMDQNFMEEYLGLRVESVDEVEILRRMEEGIYDHEAYEKALAWTKEHCKEGRDDNPEYVDFLGEKRRIKFTKEEKEKQWEFTIKMYCIIKDLIQGNKNLPAGFIEESVGHNAIAAGFQGQRQWTDHWPNCDYPEAVLNSSFDFEGPKEPMVFATENDVLNGLGMLFMELLTNRAQIFADVRTYWSPEATKRVTGYDFEGKAKENGGIIHLLNSGAACLDACGECTDENGNAVMKKWWEVTDEDIQKMTDATVWCEAGFDNFRGGGFSSHFVTRAEMPATMIRLNLVKGLGPVLQIAEGWTVHLPEEVTDTLMERTNPTWPCTWFTPRCDGKAGSRLRALTPSCRTGARTTARSPTATSARTSSRSARCCASPFVCTMFRSRISSVRQRGTRRHGPRRARTTAPAPPTARCTRTSAEPSKGRGGRIDSLKTDAMLQREQSWMSVIAPAVFGNTGAFHLPP